jgi:hypothetical protein
MDDYHLSNITTLWKKNTSAAASGAVTQKSVANPTLDYVDNAKQMRSYFPQPTNKQKVQIYCFDRTNTNKYNSTSINGQIMHSKKSYVFRTLMAVSEEKTKNTIKIFSQTLSIITLT